jgi:hypothetical protein
MKAEIRFPQSGVDAEIQAFDINGRPITAQIGRIVIEPLFNQPQQCVNILFGRTYIELPPDAEEDEKADASTKEDDIGRFTVQVRGANGKATMTDRTKRVKPQFEKRLVEAAKEGDKKPEEKEPPKADQRPPTPKSKKKGDPELAELPTNQTG